MVAARTTALAERIAERIVPSITCFALGIEVDFLFVIKKELRGRRAAKWNLKGGERSGRFVIDGVIQWDKPKRV